MYTTFSGFVYANFEKIKTIHRSILCSSWDIFSWDALSCDNCEGKKCNQIFLAVCTLDGKRLFANKCHANCAGVEYKDCPGLNMVIPGKTPLPPNKELPLRLQTVDSDPQDSLNENFWNKYIYIDKQCSSYFPWNSIAQNLNKILDTILP